MIKTLKLTSFVIAIAAIALIIMLFIITPGNSHQAEELIKNNNAIVKFQEDYEKHIANQDKATSPLLDQARLYSLFLDPPAPEPTQPTRTIQRARPSAVPRREPVNITAKFTLIGTSYFENNPEMSLALIDQPGEGLRWVRQNSKVGHVEIAEVKDGSIIIKEGTNTTELTARREQRPSLLKNDESAAASEASAPSSYTTRSIEPAATQPTPTAARTAQPAARQTPARIQPGTRPQRPQESEEVQQMVQEFFEQMEQQMQDTGQNPDQPEEPQDRTPTRRSGKISDNEANQLDELGQQLNDQNDSPEH